MLLTGVAQPSVFDVLASGTASCYFTVDGAAVDEDSQGQTYIAVGTPNFTSVQVTDIARVDAGAYDAGQHDVSLLCWTSSPRLYSSVAYFTVLPTTDPVVG